MYYSDGKIKDEKHFVNGKAEGKFFEYASNGKIERELNYKNGEQHGAEISYDDDGSVRSTTNHVNGKEHGLKKQTRSEYELTANYKEGQYDGAYSEIYTNGHVKVTGNYINGKKDGVWESGKKDGIKIRTEEYLNDDKIKETIYFNDGSVEVVREMKNGKKNGWERTYNFREGTLKSELFYKDGQLSSSTAGSGSGGASGSSGGAIKQTKQMSSGDNAYIQTFYQNNGKYDGEYTEQWVAEDKAIKTKGQYENGKKTGLWVYRDKFGQKEKEESYLNDRLDGKQVIYKANGKVSKYYHYKDGNKNGEYAVYFSVNDHMSEKGTYVNDRLDGLHTIYHQNGKVSMENMKPHNPNDPFVEKSYSEEGVMTSETHYEAGMRISEKQYYKNGKLKSVRKRDDNGNMTFTEEYDESGKKTK
jgi:antitoxin component YwqK of YwqJK toxin-antitoxin module